MKNNSISISNVDFFALCCCLLIMVAFLLTPWMLFTHIVNNTPVTYGLTGIASMSGLDFYLLVLLFVPIAGILGLVASSAALTDLSKMRVASRIELGVGLTILATYAIYFLFHVTGLVDTSAEPQLGFWLALAGAIGLIAQFFFYRPTAVAPAGTTEPVPSRLAPLPSLDKQAQPREGILSGLGDLIREYPAAYGVLFVVVAIGFLALINRNLLLFPLWSSIAFPMVAVSPFVIVGLKIPLRLKIILGLLVALIVIPILGFGDGFYLELAIQIGIYGTLALGLNIVIGFAGLLDLGYIAFFAVGAYLWSVFASTGGNTIVAQSGALAAPGLFWVFIFGGIALAALFGIVLGLPVMRLRGDYLAIVTLGFGEMIRILVSNLNNISSDPATTINITNGAQGLPGVASPPLPESLFTGMQNVGHLLLVNLGNPKAFTYQLFFYGLVLLIAAVAVLIASRLNNSAIGRAWTAIREDEIAARAMGVPLVKMKLMAFAMGASFAGAMGTIYAAKQTFVSPESFSFNQSIFIVVIVIVGGMGSIRGVLAGAVAVTLLNLQILPNFSLLINSFKNDSSVAPWIQSIFKAWPAQLEVAKYQRFVFGILLVLMMIFRPAGLVPESRRRLELEKRAAKDEPPVPLEPPTPLNPEAIPVIPGNE